MLHTLTLGLLISLGINVAMFLVAFRQGSDKLTDISYAVSFATVAILYGLQATHTQRGLVWLLSGLVLVWSVRIGGFLLYRVLKKGKDRRFDGTREDFWKFAKFWISQALTAWLLLLPIGLLVGYHAVINAHWAATVYIGVTVWGIGFALETIADYQKYRFRANGANKNRWIMSGLWHYSRHPNYFGEIVVWVGIYIAAFSALSPVGRLIATASPIFITLLLRFISGVPPLEKSADARYGDDPAYQAYRNKTNLLIPSPPR